MIVHNMEQGTQEWFDAHTGIPTASEFSLLINSKGGRSESLDAYATMLAADMYAGKTLDRFGGNKYTDRGTELEPDARALYEFRFNCHVDQVGFITNDHATYGCSPDGLVGDDGMTEFKCLIAKEHVKVLMYYKKHGRCPTTYVAQTQGQMFVTRRRWNDLFFYHPDLPSLCIRQKPDPVIYRGLKEQLQAVIEERDDVLEQIRGFA